MALDSVFGFFGSLLSFGAQANPYVLVLLLVLFIIVVYKVFQFVTRALVVGLLAAAFPWAANYALGWDLPTDISSMLWFATMAIGLFVLYALLSAIYRFLSMFAGGRTKTVVKKEEKRL